MKGNIDSNFAISILALVAACIGFAIYFNAHSIGDPENKIPVTISKHTPDKEQPTAPIQTIVVAEKIFPRNSAGEVLEQVRGEVMFIGVCPPCDDQDGVLCSVCADVPVQILDTASGETMEVYIDETQSLVLKIGQDLLLVPDTPREVVDPSDSKDLTSSHTDTQLGFSAKVSPQWKIETAQINGPQSNNRTVYFDADDFQITDSRYSVKVLHFTSNEEINSAVNYETSQIVNQLGEPKVVKENGEIGGETAQFHTFTSASEKWKLQKVFVKKDMKLFVIQGDGSQDFKSFYQSISFL